jgi:hypothetical protein
VVGEYLNWVYTLCLGTRKERSYGTGIGVMAHLTRKLCGSMDELWNAIT